MPCEGVPSRVDIVIYPSARRAPSCLGRLMLPEARKPTAYLVAPMHYTYT